MIAMNLTDFLDLGQSREAVLILLLAAIAFTESLAIIALFFPLFSTMVVLGALLGTRQDVLLPAWGAASLGSIAGYWLSYAIAYHYSLQIDDLLATSKYKSAVDRAEALFRDYGLWAVLLGRFSKPIRVTITLVAGMTRMPPLRFQFANILSACAWSGFVLLLSRIISFSQQLWR